MQESASPGYAVTAAVRASGPIVGPVRKNLIVNGRFVNGLASWLAQNTNGTAFTAINGLATLTMSLALQSSKSGGASIDSTAVLYQDISTSNYTVAGVQFFFAVNIGVNMGVNDSCNVAIGTGSGDNFYAGLYAAATTNTVYASGVMNYDFDQLTVVGECVGRADASLTYTNITLVTYAPSLGSTIGCAVTGNIIRNGAFNTALSPWAVSQTATAQSAGVVSGQFVVRYAAGTAPYQPPFLITQPVSVPANEQFVLTADLYFTTGNNSDVCSVRFSSDAETLYFTGQVYTTQYFPVNFSGRFGNNVASWQIAVLCSGNSANSVAVDNVAVSVSCGS